MKDEAKDETPKKAPKKPRAKRSYLTKEDAISFGNWLLSDERRLYYKRKQEALYAQDLPNPIPWTTLVKVQQPEDYKIWKGLVDKDGAKYTQEDLLEAYDKGVSDTKSKLYKSHD